MTLLVVGVLVGVVVAGLVASGVAASQGPKRAPAPVSEGLRAQARALRERGQAIEAIKLVRTQTGLGLREAKDVVDSLE